MDYRRKSATKWNLMLLLGRPIAFVGLLQLILGMFLSPSDFVVDANQGLFLVLLGFVVGWSGKIGKFLFYERG